MNKYLTLSLLVVTAFAAALSVGTNTLGSEKKYIEKMW